MKIERAIEEQRIDEILRQLQEGKTDFDGICLIHLLDELTKKTDSDNLQSLLDKHKVITTYTGLKNAIIGCGNALPSNKKLRSYIKRLYQGLYQLKTAWSKGELANQAEEAELNRIAVQNLMQVYQQKESAFSEAFEDMIKQKLMAVATKNFQAWQNHSLEPSQQTALDELFSYAIEQAWQYQQNNNNNSIHPVLCAQLEGNKQHALLNCLKNKTLPEDLSKDIRKKLSSEIVRPAEIKKYPIIRKKLIEVVNENTKEHELPVDKDYKKAFENDIFEKWQNNYLDTTLVEKVESFILEHIKAIKITDEKLSRKLHRAAIEKLFTQFKTSAAPVNSDQRLEANQQAELAQYLQATLITSLDQKKPIYNKTQCWLLEIVMLELVKQWQRKEFKDEQLKIIDKVLINDMQQQLDKLTHLIYPANTTQQTVEVLNQRVHELEQKLAALSQQFAAEAPKNSNKKLTDFFVQNPSSSAVKVTTDINQVNISELSSAENTASANEQKPTLSASLPNLNSGY